MGLHSDVTEAIQDAFNFDLADAVNVVSLVYSSASYNPLTGLVTPSGTTVATRGVVEPVSNEMVDGEAVTIADTSFLILKDELSVIPKVGDKLTVGTIDYSINIVIIDPADVAWNIIGRAV